MSKRALLLIDIQNDYFADGKWPLVGMDAAAERAARLIAAAREKGDLVVHVRHEFPSDDAPFFTPDSVGARIHQTVTPTEGEPVVLKHQVNAFHETNLKDLLDGHGVEELVLCGAMSHMCVDAAARAASDHGFRVMLIHDACATRAAEFNGVSVPAEQVHAAFMGALGFAYATPMTTDEYLSESA